MTCSPRCSQLIGCVCLFHCSTELMEVSLGLKRGFPSPFSSFDIWGFWPSGFYTSFPPFPSLQSCNLHFQLIHGIKTPVILSTAPPLPPCLALLNTSPDNPKVSSIKISHVLRALILPPSLLSSVTSAHIICFSFPLNPPPSFLSRAQCPSFSPQTSLLFFSYFARNQPSLLFYSIGNAAMQIHPPPPHANTTKLQLDPKKCLLFVFWCFPEVVPSPHNSVYIVFSSVHCMMGEWCPSTGPEPLYRETLHFLLILLWLGVNETKWLI